MKKFEHGGDVWHGNPDEWLDFSSNINALGCPGFIRQALKDAMDEVVYYPQVDMSHAIRGLSRMLGVSEDCVLPTNGGIGALDLAIGKLSPTRVVVVSPAFVEYERIATVYGIPFEDISMLEERNTVVFPVDKLAQTLAAGDMLIICNPSNPMGYGLDRETMKQMIELALSKKVALLVDEAFADFCEELSVRDLVQDYDNLIIAGSLTKLFAIPGVRLGYLSANSDIISALKAYQTPWVLSSFANRVAVEAGDSDAFIAQTVAKTAEERYRLKASLEGFGLFVFDSYANYLLTDLKPVGITTAAMAEKLYTHRILVRNCENFGRLDAFHMRVAVKREKDNEKLIGHISEILKGSI